MTNPNDVKEATELPVKNNEIKPNEKNQSATIGKLVLALSKAQGLIQPAKEDSENPFFKSKYADLSSVWNACRNQLSRNELAVIQTTSTINGEVIIRTTLAHSSGEWIRGHITIKPDKNNAQGLGSAITYGRRYGLSAMVGIAPDDDDDGNAASGSKKKQGQDLPATPQKIPSKVITEPQRKRLFTIGNKSEISYDEIKVHLFEVYGIDSSSKILKSDYEKICDWVSAQKVEG